jgi:hypothetical protein
MRAAYSIITFLVAKNSVSAGNAAAADQVPTLAFSPILRGIYSFLVSGNPFVLIILGVILFFAGKLSKLIGIILVILGLIHLILPYLIRII